MHVLKLKLEGKEMFLHELLASSHLFGPFPLLSSDLLNKKVLLQPLPERFIFMSPLNMHTATSGPSLRKKPQSSPNRIDSATYQPALALACDSRFRVSIFRSTSHKNCASMFPVGSRKSMHSVTRQLSKFTLISFLSLYHPQRMTDFTHSRHNTYIIRLPLLIRWIHPNDSQISTFEVLAVACPRVLPIP